MIRKTILAILLTVLTISAADAQGQKRDGRMTQWLEEMRQLRTGFIVKELELTNEQKEKFVPLYEAMCRDVEKLMHDTRSLERTVRRKGAAASNLELEKASEALYESKGKENVIEMRYFNKFKSILTPQQLFNLKHAEHKFNKQLMNQRRSNKARK